MCFSFSLLLLSFYLPLSPLSLCVFHLSLCVFPSLSSCSGIFGSGTSVPREFPKGICPHLVLKHLLGTFLLSFLLSFSVSLSLSLSLSISFSTSCSLYLYLSPSLVLSLYDLLTQSLTAHLSLTLSIHLPAVSHPHVSVCLSVSLTHPLSISDFLTISHLFFLTSFALRHTISLSLSLFTFFVHFISHPTLMFSFILVFLFCFLSMAFFQAHNPSLTLTLYRTSYVHILFSTNRHAKCQSHEAIVSAYPGVRAL